MLTARLNRIVRHVNSETAADIGTDHAYVPIELILKNRARKVIATDVRDGPLRIAKANVEKHGLSDKIELRRGDGLSVLKPDEADTIIMAGMGGELICDLILKEIGISRGATLILQPMSAQYELRKFLIENDFTVVDEDIECEGFRVYNFLTVKSGKQAPFEKDIDYHIPPYLIRNKNFNRLYEKKWREFEKIINGLNKSKNREDDRLDYYVRCLCELKRMNSQGE